MEPRLNRGELCSRLAIKLEKMITTLFGSQNLRSLTLDEDSADEPKLGFFDRMRQAVSRTRESFSAKISDLAALTRTVDESALDELESMLLSSDLGVPTTTAILDALRDRARHQAIEGGAELRALLKEQLIAILCCPARRAASQRRQPLRQRSLSSSASTAPAKPLRAASSPHGPARKAAPFFFAPPTHFAPLPSSSLKSGPRAPASR